MRHLLGGMAAAVVLAGVVWTAPATAAITPAKSAGFHVPSAGLTDVAMRRRYRIYRRYPRYGYYRPYAAPYYGPSYYPYPYYRPYYRPGFYIGTPFFGFGF
jgi:hypothetical protein